MAFTRHDKSNYSARTGKSTDGSIAAYWCDLSIDCYGIHGLKPKVMPEHLKISLPNIEIDSNLTYPGMVVIDFKKDPRKHFFE